MIHVLFLNRQRTYFNNGKESAVFEVAVCDDCGRIAIVGKIESRRLVQASKLEEEVEYYYLATDDNTDIEDDRVFYQIKKSKAGYVILKNSYSIITKNIYI